MEAVLWVLGLVAIISTVLGVVALWTSQAVHLEVVEMRSEQKRHERMFDDAAGEIARKAYDRVRRKQEVERPLPEAADGSDASPSRSEEAAAIMRRWRQR
jgi:FtsZ-interacting cell division protein ZipA